LYVPCTGISIREIRTVYMGFVHILAQAVFGFSPAELVKSSSHVAGCCNCYVIATCGKLKIWLWVGLQ